MNNGNKHKSVDANNFKANKPQMAGLELIRDGKVIKAEYRNGKWIDLLNFDTCPCCGYITHHEINDFKA